MVQFINYFLHLHNIFDNNNSSSNSSCPNASFKWCFNDIDGYNFCILSPTLIPTCILALIIGLYSSKRISELSKRFSTRWLYQLTFFLFGMMMTSAGILHCFLGDVQKLSNILQDDNIDSFQCVQLLFAIIDVGLTTSIAVSFLFCGLCDVGFLDPKSKCTRVLLISSYFVVFLLWTLGILNQWTWTFHVLYLGVISVCCFIYLITQLCIRSNRHALPSLFAGGLYGAIGLLATSVFAQHICQAEGPLYSQLIGPEFIWFIFSDISMAFMFMYVIRANRQNNVVISNYAIEMEKHQEKF